MIGLKYISQSVTWDELPVEDTGLVVDTSSGDITVTLNTSNNVKREGCKLYICKNTTDANSIILVQDDGSDFSRDDDDDVRESYEYRFIVLTVADGAWYILNKGNWT